MQFALASRLVPKLCPKSDQSRPPPRVRVSRPAAMAAAAGGNKVTLKSSDGVVFEVEEAVAMESQTIKHVIEADCDGGDIPLPNVTGKILAKVIKYCKKHVDMRKQVEDSKSADEEVEDSVSADEEVEDSKSADEELKVWDAEFVKVNQATLFDLILAANYLNIKSLLDLTCQTVADMIKGKTPNEIKKILNVKNDYTPEEEEELRRENQWAFE